jgi:DNA-binding transcriptional LysR family regulator
MTEIGNPINQRYAAAALAIDLQHLRFAVVADDCGSLRRAADILSVKHSVLSRSISQLEHFIGASLFERSSGGVKSTVAGRSVLRTARLILEQVDALVDTGRSNGRGEAGQISVGFCTSISAGNLRATLLEFKARFPHVELTTTELSRSRLTTFLRAGILDVLVVTEELPSFGSKILPLWSERILVCLREDHRLATCDAVYWTDLREEKVLISRHDPGRELENLLVSKLVSAEDRPKIERHDVSRGIIKSLVSMGVGVSLVLESDVGAKFAGLVYRDLRDGGGSSRIGFSAQWRADNENPALGSFLKILGERYSSPAAAR